jgi:hypothetical protein
MIVRSALLLSLLTLASSTGCASPSDDAEAADEVDVVAAKDFVKYGLSVGFAATGADARTLYKAIKDNGGKPAGDHAVLAGLTSLELGLSKAGEDDADEGFGITCQAAEGDSTFHADTCALHAVVQMEGQEPNAVKLTGKLAAAVASALPRTSPEGLVGSMTRGAGGVSCKTIPGPTGTTCTVKAMVVTETFDALVKGDAKMKPTDAKKAIAAFFPKA